MIALFRSFNNYIFRKVDTSSFLLFKQAPFTAYADFLFIVLMAVLIAFASTYEPERFLSVLKPSIIVIIVAFVSIFAIISGKTNTGVNIMAIGAAIMSSLGLIISPPHLSGVSFVYFMYVDITYAAFFCSNLVSVLILLALVITRSVHYFVMYGPTATGLTVEILKTSYIDGLVTLICVFATGFFASRFMARALEISRDEGEKIASQLVVINGLVDTIRSTANELGGAINLNSELVESYSDNAQNQAASVEELTSTLEQISTGTENVEKQTADQNQAINNLMECLDTLAMSIDLTEHHSTDINDLFISFVRLTDEGKAASQELDQLNRKILKNSIDVASVTSIIEEFFDKINLLSLNASIEAARAGEHGKGFAVVASEVRKLAEKTMGATSEVGNSISTIQQLAQKNIKGMEESAEAMQSTAQRSQVSGEMLESIVDMADAAAAQVQSIATAAEEQSAASEEITRSIEEINAIANESRAMAGNAEQSVSALHDEARNLQEIIYELKEEAAN